MRCNHCNARLGIHDLWCVSCGKQTPAVKNDLSALKSIKETWAHYAEFTSKNIPAAAYSVFFGVLPIVALLWLFNSLIQFEPNSSLGMIGVMLLKALGFSIFVPFVFLPLAAINPQDGYLIPKESLPGVFKRYFSYFCLAVISALYYILIYLICFGLPNFGSDPILRLVWIVLANYWLGIIIPVPALMELRELSALKALALSYRHIHDLRWNLYLLALVLVVMNAIAFSLLTVGLMISIPFSLFVIRDYTQKLIDFELLEYRR
jgi:hypothetical protein